MSAFRSALRLRRAIPAIVLFALVFAQTLGAMHRVVHAPRPGQTTNVAGGVQSGAQAALPAARTAGHGWLLALFSGHTGEHGCDLYDQLSHADGLAATVLASWATTVVESPVAAAASPAVRERALPVRARGPPLLA